MFSEIEEKLKKLQEKDEIEVKIYVGDKIFREFPNKYRFHWCDWINFSIFVLYFDFCDVHLESDDTIEVNLETCEIIIRYK